MRPPSVVDIRNLPGWQSARSGMQLLSLNAAMALSGPVAGISSLPGAIDQSRHGAAWTDRANVSPQDIAEGVAFLCLDAGRYVTGCVLQYAFHG